MVAPFSRFYGKIWVGLCLNTEKRFFSEVSYFTVSRKSIDFSKNGTKDFQNSPPFKRSTCFYVAINGNFERFQYFNFETDFMETKTFFKKLE